VSQDAATAALNRYRDDIAGQLPTATFLPASSPITAPTITAPTITAPTITDCGGPGAGLVTYSVQHQLVWDRPQYYSAMLQQLADHWHTPAGLTVDNPTDRYQMDITIGQDGIDVTVLLTISSPCVKEA
jgi:hypothetical protein